MTAARIQQQHTSADSSESGPVAAALARALKRLPTVPSWSAIVAENIYWASFEPFVQSSLLWSINTLDGSALLSDREREVVCWQTENENKKMRRHSIKPDHSVFRADCRSDWSAAYKKRDLRGLRRLSIGFANAKLAWSEGDASGGSTIPNIADKIETDIGKLRRLEQMIVDEQPNERKEFLVVAGCASIRDDARTSIEAAECCEAKLLTQLHSRLREKNCSPVRPLDERIWLVKGESVPSVSKPAKFTSLLATILDVSSHLSAEH